jgi:predicted HTH domain antitoxin
METPTPQSLVDARLYESEADVMRDALRYLLRARPDLRINLAVHRYTTEDLSLARSAHLAGVSWPEMRDILRERGIPLRLGPETVDEARQEGRAIDEHLGGAE